MRLRGINAQLLLAGILPALVIALVLVAWFVSTRITDLRDHQAELGTSLVSQLAPAVEYGVFTRDELLLQRLADVALDKARLQSVTIRDRDGQVLAESVQEPLQSELSLDLSQWLAGLMIDPDSSESFTAQVVPPVTDLGEFDLPSDDGAPRVIGEVEITLPLLPAVAQQVNTVLTAMLILAFGLMVSVVVALYSGRQIGRPILALADMIRRFRSGDLSARAAEQSRNELGLLETGLNRMADEVQRTQEFLQDRINKATAELTETLEAMEISNVELDLARRRAIEASHLKSEFLASMSHEIRTPMSSVLTYTRMLSRTPLSPEQHEQVATIERSAQSLMRLLNDILDLSKIEAGMLSLEHEPFNVRNCIDEPLSLLAPLAYERGLHVSRCVHPDVPVQLRGDQGRIQQILTNLVSNAIKYTIEGEVRVELRHEPPAGLHLQVTDTGPGIKRKDQLRLFQEFGQSKTTPDSHMPGSGLGLVICSRLVDAMGGEIELHSEPGHGTTVSARIRLEAADEPELEQPLTGHSVLLCEPDPLTRVHLAQLLEYMGLDVESRPDRDIPPGSHYDLWLIGLDRNEMAAPEALADRIPATGPPAVYLLDSIDPSDTQRVASCLGGRCISRCMPLDTLQDTLQGILHAQTQANAGETRASKALDGVRVLVTDDNRIHRTMLARQLAYLGAIVQTAADGAEAVVACKRADYDAVMLDLQMPDMSGIETARELSGLDKPPHLVAVTADAMQEFEELRLAGFSDYLVKPVEEGDLLTVFRSSKHKLDRQIRDMLAVDLPAQYARLVDTIGRGDREATRAALHDLSGTAAICRLDALARETERLRGLTGTIQDPDLEVLARVVDEIMQEIR